MNAICRNFLWYGQCFGKKTPIAWKVVCTDKAEGDLDCKDFVLFNKAMVISQVWDIRLDESCLVVNDEFYFRNTSFWHFQLKSHNPWFLKKTSKSERES